MFFFNAQVSFPKKAKKLCQTNRPATQRGYGDTMLRCNHERPQSTKGWSCDHPWVKMASKMANFRGFLTLDLATAKMRMEKVGLPNGDESHGTIRKKSHQKKNPSYLKNTVFLQQSIFGDSSKKNWRHAPPYLLAMIFFGMLKTRNTP